MKTHRLAVFTALLMHCFRMNLNVDKLICFATYFHPSRLRGDRSSGAATAFGLGLPLLVSAAVLTIDLANLASARASLQSLTDQAVLMGAKEMHLRQERDAVLANAVTSFFQSRAQETKI